MQEQGQGQPQWQVQDPGQELGPGPGQEHRQGQALRGQVLPESPPGRLQALHRQLPGHPLAPGHLLKSVQAPLLPLQLPMNLEPALVPQMAEQL